MEKYSDLYFEILSGGMVTGNRVGPLSQKSDYLLKKVEAIENTTNARFGEAYKEAVKEGSIISDSEPPSIAFNVFKSFRPDLRFSLAHRVQDLLFRQGKDPNLMKSYFDICDEFGINKYGFMERFSDPVYRDLTRGIFRKAEEWGIRNFPTLMLERDGGPVVIQSGYDVLEIVDKAFLKVVGTTGIISGPDPGDSQTNAATGSSGHHDGNPGDH